MNEACPESLMNKTLLGFIRGKNKLLWDYHVVTRVENLPISYLCVGISLV